MEETKSIPCKQILKILRRNIVIKTSNEMYLKIHQENLFEFVYHEILKKDSWERRRFEFLRLFKDFWGEFYFLKFRKVFLGEMVFLNFNPDFPKSFFILSRTLFRLLRLCINLFDWKPEVTEYFETDFYRPSENHHLFREKLPHGFYERGMSTDSEKCQHNACSRCVPEKYIY